LFDIDFLNGFNEMPIEEWENSVNTTMLYTNYTFTIPNEDVSLKLSGNYIVEIIDPETLQPVPEGQVGELVLTTINREGMPLLRYRTRDLTRILPGECPCGRHHIRLDRMKGRSDDMIILKGVNIFPIQIETILMQFKELASNYLITLETRDTNDEMMIEVELEHFTEDYGRMQQLTREITRLLKDEILVTPYVKLVPKGSLPQSEGKAVRVKDLRKPF
jgi:phenylacetate-CoA ligase